MPRKRPTLSIGGAPFDKFRDREARIVGVIMAGSALVEGVLMTRLPIDGGLATETLADWIRGSRFHPSLRAILIEGITIAGLSVVDLPRLHALAGIPVISVRRKLPRPGRLEEALRKLGFEDRVPSIAAAGEMHRFESLHFAAAGLSPEAARAILEENRGRGKMPEGIRIAQMIGGAVGRGTGGAELTIAN